MGFFWGLLLFLFFNSLLRVMLYGINISLLIHVKEESCVLSSGVWVPHPGRGQGLPSSAAVAWFEALRALVDGQGCPSDWRAFLETPQQQWTGFIKAN